MSTRIVWHGDKFKADLQAEQRRRLERAAMVVEREAKRLLGVSGTGTRSKSGIVKAIKNARNRVYGAFPSMPGEPPHKQTGRLRASVAHEVIRKFNWVARVGTNVLYGKHLQLGTKWIKPRPWLDVALNKTVSQVRMILTAKWNWPG